MGKESNKTGSGATERQEKRGKRRRRPETEYPPMKGAGDHAGRRKWAWGENGERVERKTKGQGTRNRGWYHALVHMGKKKHEAPAEIVRSFLVEKRSQGKELPSPRYTTSALTCAAQVNEIAKPGRDERRGKAREVG